MFNKCTFVLLALAGAVASSQCAHGEERLGKGVGDSALTTEVVKTGLYLISGGGGNSLLRLSANGLIVVDGKLPGNYEALLKQVNRISKQPVRVLIVTDHHEEHTGNNARFLEAGTAILAHENLKRNLPGKAPPTKTFDREFTLQLGGIDAQVLHFGNARTNADTVVYFPNLKVVAVGGLYAPTPDPDFSAGGSLVGWGPVLAQILKLDFDVVVPDTGRQLREPIWKRSRSKSTPWYPARSH